jgi:LPS O-antigen subunit length determinant protein (WzzB/FepE family)/predicted transcriptional regulator
MVSRAENSQPSTPLKEGRTAALGEDEIDLVDLGAALVRRWKLIIGVFLFCIALGVIAALFKKPDSAYSAGIQLAAYTTTNGGTVQLLSPESAKSLLQSGLIDAGISHYAESHTGFDPRKIKLSADVVKDGNVVILSGKGAIALQNAYATIIEQTVADLAKYTSGPMESHRANLQNTLQLAQIDLSKLDDPKVIQADKAAKKGAVIDAQARLASLLQAQNVLQQKLEHLNESINLYTALAKQLGEYLKTARKNALASARGAASPTQAMAGLLLGNQIQQTQTQLTDIQNRLTVTLPLKIAQTQADLANNKQKQVAQKTAVEQAQLEYDNFETQHARTVKAQQANIDKLNTQIANIQNTRLVAPPTRSIEPVMSRKMIVILAAILGIFLGLFAAGVAGYWGAVRRALRQ